MTNVHRITDALSLAIEAHDGQVRKSTNIPYISHPLAVASLVLEYGGSEDQVIAGLLHDAIEDGGSAYAPRIAATFGAEVLALVEACSDGTAESKAEAKTPAAKKADWKRRKLDYLQRLETEDPAALLVTACDKLHNARAIVADLERIGTAVFERFTAGRDGTLWYYTEAHAVLKRRQCPVSYSLGDVLVRMRYVSKKNDDLNGALAFAATLDSKERAQFSAILGGLQTTAQALLSDGSRTLGFVSEHQQRLIAICQQIDAIEVDAELLPARHQDRAK
jgi:hypothetical protein